MDVNIEKVDKAISDTLTIITSLNTKENMMFLGAIQAAIIGGIIAETNED